MFKTIIFQVLIVFSFQSAHAFQECISAKDYTNASGVPLERNFSSSFTSGQIPYSIIGSSFGLIEGISRDQGAAAVVMAADTWNEQTNSGHFVEVSNNFDDLDPYTEYFLPEWDDSICKYYVKSSVVRVLHRCFKGGFAKISPHCKNRSTGKAKRFEMWITSSYSASDSVCKTTPWSVGVEKDSKLDLTSIVLHEFGHTLNLWHVPKPFANSVVDSYAPTSGTIKERDLYEYDIRCAVEVGGSRKLKSYTRVMHPGENQFGSESILNNTSVSQVAAGKTYLNGYEQISYSYRPTSSWNLYWGGFFNRYFPWIFMSREILNKPGGAFTDATTLDDLMWSKLIWSNKKDYLRTYGSYTSYNHVGQTGRWDNDTDIVSTWFNYLVEICHNASCDSSDHLWTAKPVTVAWHEGIGQPLITWVNQHRAFSRQGINGYNYHNEIYISVGYHPGRYNRIMPLKPVPTSGSTSTYIA